MSVKKFLQNIAAILVFCALVHAIVRIKQCTTPIIGITTTAQKPLNTAIDSLQHRLDSLQAENAWLIYTITNRPPTTKTTTKGNTTTITITDTIEKIVHLTDTILRNQIVTIHTGDTTTQCLKLPTTFTITDTPHIALSGIIDTIGLTVKNITLTNQITLTNTKKRSSFFTESHAITFQNSNPYITTITPIYIYKTPTRKSQFFEKIICTAAGFGVGYIKGKNAK